MIMKRVSSLCLALLPLLFYSTATELYYSTNNRCGENYPVTVDGVEHPAACLATADSPDNRRCCSK